MEPFSRWLTTTAIKFKAKALLVSISTLMLAVMLTGITYQQKSLYIKEDKNTKTVETPVKAVPTKDIKEVASTPTAPVEVKPVVSQNTAVKKPAAAPVVNESPASSEPSNGVAAYSTVKPRAISVLNPDNDFMLDANGNPTNYTRKLTGKAVAYSSKNPNAGTASGLMKAMPGAVAVDPRIIPYGSKLYIKTANNSFIYGYAIAADTGGFIHFQNPPLVDLFFGSYNETVKFGAKTMEVYILE
jgi:3D (Asp-Asp-Asp) domain-containing protein